MIAFTKNAGMSPKALANAIEHFKFMKATGGSYYDRCVAEWIEYFGIVEE